MEETEKTKNFINLDCSKMNSKGTVELASKILSLLKDNYSEYDALIKITIKADND